MKLSAPPPPPPEPPEPEPTPEPNKDGEGTAGADAPGPAGEASGGLTSPVSPAPEPSPQPKPAAWPAWFPGVDAALVVLTVALGFLVASFAARNSDLWLHLGAGRMLTTGEYRLGSDPLSYTGADRPWVNHSWLFDLGAYLLYGGSGTVLVGLKAVVVAAAVALLIAIRRPGQPLWPWAVCATLAVLAMAPRLTLSPHVGSVLLLAGTLFVLFRVPSPPGSWRVPLALGAIFWVWANVDSWFVLGPLALALVLLGEVLQQKYFQRSDAAGDADEPLGKLPDVPTLARSLAVGVVACMLNPHHVRVWEVPFEVAGSPALAVDPQLATLVTAPVDKAYSDREGFGNNLNGLAYAVLLLGGGAVLGFGVGRLRVAHLALWVGFALLSLRTMYAIPFFAAVAVPLAAGQLNARSARVVLGDQADRRTRLVLTGSAGGRVLSLAGLLALCAAAWPGWLHPPSSAWWGEGVGNPADARRVAWAVEPDPGLERAARQFEAWRENRQLPDDARGVIAAVELANYCAWYAPREKVFLNGRFNHHRPELPEFVAVRRATDVRLGADEPPDPREAARVLQKHGAEYLAVYDPRRQTGSAALVRRVAPHEVPTVWQLVGWENWSTWYLDGRAVVFGWQPGPGQGRPTFAALRVDPAALAFGPGVERVPPAKADPPPPPREWADDFTRPVRPAAPGAEEALGWLEYKESLKHRQARLHQVRVSLLRVVPGVAAPPLPGNLMQAQLEGAAEAGSMPFFAPPDGSFIALPVLAVRAARRAIAANPDHPDGYYALALALSDPDLPVTEGERTLGIVTALRQCLTRMPTPAKFRRNVYAASPTLVARRLARVYLGPRISEGQYMGMRVDGTPVGDLTGDLLARVAFKDKTGAVQERGIRLPAAALGGLPPGAELMPGRYVQPLDLARQALVQATEYAAIEFGPGGEQGHPLTRDLEAERKQVEGVLQLYLERYSAAAEQTQSAATRFQMARQAGLIGEAVGLLKGLKEGELVKAFGPAAPAVAVELVALELGLGRLEDAAADLAALADEVPRMGGLPPERLDQLRGALRYLEYQKLVLEGDYAGAGTALEAAERPVLEAKLPPDLEKFDRRPFLEYGASWPLVPMLGAADSPYGVVTRYALGYAQFQEYAGRRQMIAGHLQQQAEFYFRRGYLSLLEGDVGAAAERFRQSLDCQPPPGWGLTAPRLPASAEYLRLIDRAGKKVGG